MRWWWLLLMGCRAHTPTVNAADNPVRYKASILGEFGPVLSDSSGEELQGPIDVALDLQLQLTPVRSFRDGSYGRLVSVEAVQFLQQNADGIPVDNDLMGRTVELRTFPDGEILDISWGEKVAGQKRYLDVFEVIFPAISPSAPSIGEGDTVKQRIIWPFRKGNEMRWDNIVDAVWSNHGHASIGTKDTWKLSYEGDWGTEGKTRRSSPAEVWLAKGTATGTAHFDRKSSDLVSHRLEWTRKVSLKGEATTVTQEQRFSVHVERLP